MNAPTDPTVEQLIRERQELRSWLEAEEKRFNDHYKPTRERIAGIDQQIMAMMQAQGLKSFKTDYGTAIVSQRDTPKVIDGKREDYIDWCMDNWDAWGGEMLQIGTPKAEAVRNYMDKNKGQLPPNVLISTMYTFSVRK